MAAIDQLKGVMDVIDTVQGEETKTRTKGKRTTQTNVSDAGVQQIVRSILSGQGGVSSVGNAARRSGLYNSTTESTQLGNLYATAANQAELARSPTTVNSDTTQTMERGGMDAGTLAGVIGGGMLLSKMFGGDGGGALLGNALEGSPLTGLASFLGSEGGGAGLGFGLGDSLVSGSLGGASFAGDAGGLLGGLGNFGGIGGLMGGMGDDMAGLGSLFGGGMGGMGGMGAGFGPVGNFMSGLLGGSDEATDPLNLGTAALMGAATMGPIGAIAAPLAGVGGGLLSGLFGDGSVICTALRRKGWIPEDLYKAGHLRLDLLPYTVREGYQLWAKPIAWRIDKGNLILAALCYFPTMSYLRFSASNLGWKAALRHPLGALMMYFGEPACEAAYYRNKAKHEEA